MLIHLNTSRTIKRTFSNIDLTLKKDRFLRKDLVVKIRKWTECYLCRMSTCAKVYERLGQEDSFPNAFGVIENHSANQDGLA